MKSHELSYLQELMQDFPVLGGINNVEQALQEIDSRFLSLEQHSGNFAPTDEARDFPAYYMNLAIQFHAILYGQILSNAGKYRQVHEPNRGSVLFGPNQKFKGTAATEISQAILQVFSFLDQKGIDPIVDAITFYQRFVQIHPFYDANGRIGRLIITLYLNHQGYYMNWGGLYKNSKWLKLLNECHERYGQDVYDEYLNRLIIYWKKRIIPKQDLEKLE